MSKESTIKWPHHVVALEKLGIDHLLRKFLTWLKDPNTVDFWSLSRILLLLLFHHCFCHISQGRGQIQMSVILHGLTRSREMTDILKTNSIVQDLYDAVGNMTFITTKNV